MELHILKNFLQIARDGNMTRAAEFLHLSQPTLSKQMKDLESELGKKLFRRSANKMLLTDEGMLLRKRAEDIVEMVDKTTNEFQTLDLVTGGDIHIGCAESYQIRYLARIIKDLKKEYPLLRFHLLSGDTSQVAERLDKGLLDIAVIAEPPDLSKYNYIQLPESDTWGLVMRKDCNLAKKECITADDLIGLELICSRQAIKVDLPRWCGEKADKFVFAGTGNLTYNGSVFAKEGLGYLLTFEHLANISNDSELCFRPLLPTLETSIYIVWKKYQVFTPIAEVLVQELSQRL